MPSVVPAKPSTPVRIYTSYSTCRPQPVRINFFPPMQQHMDFNIEEVCDQVHQVSSGPSNLSFEIFGELYTMFLARGQVFKDIERRKMLTDTDFARLQVLYSTTLAASLGLVDM